MTLDTVQSGQRYNDPNDVFPVPLEPLSVGNSVRGVSKLKTSLLNS